MSNIPASPLLKLLLFRGLQRRRMWVSIGAMAMGIFLLLVAVLLWWNFRYILQGKATDDSLASTFLTVSRRVTNENMGLPRATQFDAAALDALRHAPQVQDLGVIRSLRPQAYMRLNIAPGLGFSTVMVLESVPDRFIDHHPADWSWKPGSRRLPVILSSSFLSLYNYAFAPSQGLPQLSEESIRALPFTIDVGAGGATTPYAAQVVGFSDRISSVLAPESFIRYANAEVGGTDAISRVVLKVKDPSDAAFAEFLSTHGYVTNSEMLRWSRLRGVVDLVAAVLGILAIVLLAISLLTFALFVELTVSRARDSIVLLGEIGYSAAELRAFLNANLLPLLCIALGSACLVAVAMQIAAATYARHAGLQLLLLPGWPFWLSIGAVCAIMLLQLTNASNNALRNV